MCLLLAILLHINKSYIIKKPSPTFVCHVWGCRRVLYNIVLRHKNWRCLVVQTSVFPSFIHYKNTLFVLKIPPSRTEIIYTLYVTSRIPSFLCGTWRSASGTLDGAQIYRNTFARFRKLFVIKLTDQLLPELVLDTVSTL